MYDKCESCGKKISSADDCRLCPGRDGKVHTFCVECSEKKVR